MTGNSGPRKSKWWEKGLLTFKDKASLGPQKIQTAFFTHITTADLTTDHSSCLARAKCLWSLGQPLSRGPPNRYTLPPMVA